ncbi:MAG: hypothetical protein HY608_01640 [Planctomycetes bacterium]|nr:hypothetical protein [Planctomycetota bacterium]
MPSGRPRGGWARRHTRVESWENDDYRWIEPARLAEFDTVPGLERALAAVWPSPVS